MDAQTYFSRLSQLLAENAPYADDAKMLEKIAKVGIEPGKPFQLADLDPAVALGLTKAVADIWGKLADRPDEHGFGQRLDQSAEPWRLRHGLRHPRRRRLARSRRAQQERGDLPVGLHRRRGTAARLHREVHDDLPEGPDAALRCRVVDLDLRGQLLRPQGCSPEVGRGALDADQDQRRWQHDGLHPAGVPRCRSRGELAAEPHLRADEHHDPVLRARGVVPRRLLQGAADHAGRVVRRLTGACGGRAAARERPAHMLIVRALSRRPCSGPARRRDAAFLLDLGRGGARPVSSISIWQMRLMGRALRGRGWRSGLRARGRAGCRCASRCR